MQKIWIGQSIADSDWPKTPATRASEDAAHRKALEIRKARIARQTRLAKLKLPKPPTDESFKNGGQTG